MLLGEADGTKGLMANCGTFAGGFADPNLGRGDLQEDAAICPVFQGLDRIGGGGGDGDGGGGGPRRRMGGFDGERRQGPPSR